MRLPILASLLCFAAAPALAGDPPPVAPPVGAPPGTVAAPSPPPAAEAKPKAPGATVSPLTVYPATNPPKLAKSFPAAGQDMASGILVMSVTFDQPMLPTGFDYGPADGGEQPHCLNHPRLLDDNKTFVLLCTTEPSKTYAMSFNAKPQTSVQGGFENVAQHRAEPATLSFKTNASPDGAKDIHEAMKAAGLRDSLDMPIEISPDRHGDADAPPKT